MMMRVALLVGCATPPCTLRAVDGVEHTAHRLAVRANSTATLRPHLPLMHAVDRPASTPGAKQTPQVSNLGRVPLCVASSRRAASVLTAPEWCR